MKRALIALLIIGVIGVGAGAYYMRRTGNDITVNTAPISRGDIIDTVSATGTLQAVTTVQVGSQVSGNIAFLGADFNSIVHKGQVIARIDPSIFQAQVEQARANVGKARADLVRSQADAERAKVAVTDAEQKFTRTKELADRKLLPQSDLDAAKITLDSAQAALQSAQAQLQSSRATVEQAQASLNQNQVNLDHCVITAPIDGIVTQRSVDVGQTVAASLQSPTLFIIAADLTKMQVNANIDEADVGRIRPRQTVTFRVDAFPADEFTGSVSQIRLQPIVVQNVTTYGTIVEVPNTDLRLKPGMTANIKVQIARRSDVLRIPNAALRFRPTAEMFTALSQAVPPEMQGGRGGRAGRGGNGAAPGGAAAAGPAPTASGAPSPAPSASVPSASATQAPAQSGAAAPGGMRGTGMGGGMGSGGGFGRGQGGPGGSGGPGGGQGQGGDAADRQARMLERFKTMSPDEQTQFLERMQSRGMDVSAFKAARAPAPVAKNPAGAQSPAPAAETIDALFGPLPTVESTGRAWLFANRELKAVRLRLGITDGTNTEILGGELQGGTEVVTGMIVGTATRSTSGGTGNPLMPQRGGPGGRPPGR